MNSFNFQIILIDTISSILTPFPEHICYFTEDTEKYYIWKDGILKEIFVDTTSLSWTNVSNTPTTLSGYGITDSVASNNGTVNFIARFTPDGSEIGNSQIQDDGNTIGFNASPNEDVSYYFSSTDKIVGKFFTHSYNGNDSVVSNDVELSGTISTFNRDAIGYGINNTISNLSGNGKNYGIKGTVSGADINIGASFSATGGSNSYAIELKDGTQAEGKFLKSVTSDGKANWANITTDDIQGYQSSNFSLSESKAIFVDATYGDDTTGTKYDPSKPFLTWLSARAVAVAGDWIVFNAGSYSQAMTPLSNVNVFCKPGVIFSAGFSITTSTTWRLHGYATFDATTPLVITSSGATHDIYFEYDRTTGLCNSGVECNDLTAAMLRLTYNCNYLTASRPLRFDNNAVGATYDVVVNVSQRITGYGDRTIFLPSSFTSGSIFGSIIINANIIENTSSSTVRQVLWFAPTNTNNFQMYINAKIIRATSTSFTDPGVSNVSCILFYEGGDNININANIDAGELPCIVNRSQGGTPIYGNMTVTGNIFSKREIVQQYQKQANGNGWHDITIKNGFIHSKGIGLSNAMLHRENTWNYVHTGLPGNTKLVDCIIYNENINSSATATIVKDDLLDVGKNNNFQLYNCLAFVETSGFLATSTQATKYISAHNVRTNRALGTTVLDGFSPSGVIVDTNLTIPKTNINV